MWRPAKRGLAANSGLMTVPKGLRRKRRQPWLEKDRERTTRRELATREHERRSREPRTLNREPNLGTRTQNPEPRTARFTMIADGTATSVHGRSRRPRSARGSWRYSRADSRADGALDSFTVRTHLRAGQMDGASDSDPPRADRDGAGHPRALGAVTTPTTQRRGSIRTTGSRATRRRAGADALNALVAMSTMNHALFAIAVGHRARHAVFPSGVRRDLSVDWLIHQMAGHQIHHLKQLEVIAKLLKAGKAGGLRREGGWKQEGEERAATRWRPTAC